MLRAALRSRALRIALAALLLFAQQTALTHALTHAGWQAHGIAAHDDDHDHGYALSTAHGGDASDKSNSSKSATSEQCAFDLVYSQVACGLTVVFVHFQAPAGIFERMVRRSSADVVAEPPPFFSQGPPAFL